MRLVLSALLLVVALFAVAGAAEAAPKEKEKECVSPPGRMQRTEAPRTKQSERARPFCTPTPDPGLPPPVVVPDRALDSFDRPDSPVLGRSESGQVWEELGDWAICDQRACAVGPPGDGIYARVPTSLQGQRVAVTVAPRPVGSEGQAAVVAQMTPDWGRYAVYVGLTSTGRVELWLLTNFQWSDGPIAAVDTPYDSSAPRRLEVRAVPGSVSVYVDGRRVLGPIALPQPPPDATYAGIYAETADPSAAGWPRFDAFAVTRER